MFRRKSCCPVVLFGILVLIVHSGQPAFAQSEESVPKADLLLSDWERAYRELKATFRSFQVVGTITHSASPEIKVNGKAVDDSKEFWRSKRQGNKLFIDVSNNGRFDYNPIHDYRGLRRTASFDGVKWYFLDKDNTHPTPLQMKQLGFRDPKRGYPWTEESPFPPTGYTSTTESFVRRNDPLPSQTMGSFSPFWFDPIEFLSDPIHQQSENRTAMFAEVRKLSETQNGKKAKVGSVEKINGRDCFPVEIPQPSGSGKSTTQVPQKIWFARDQGKFVPWQFQMNLPSTSLRLTVTFLSDAHFANTWYPTSAVYRAEYPEPGTGQWRMFKQDVHQWTLTRINENFTDEEFRIAFPAYASVVFDDGRVQERSDFPDRPWFTRTMAFVLLSIVFMALGLVIVLRRRSAGKVENHAS